MAQTQSELITAFSTVLDELIRGSRPGAGFVLNPEDPGLLESLDKLSAQGASALPQNGAASIAAHVDHLSYGLGLMNRWSRGENPFADADYSASWRRLIVSDEEWSELRKELKKQAQDWRAALQTPREITVDELTGITASIVHLAYHFGAIRQINRSLRGPAAIV